MVLNICTCILLPKSSFHSHVAQCTILSMLMFMVALFVVVQTWNKSNYPSAVEWINKFIQCHTLLQWKETQLDVPWWMNIKNIVFFWPTLLGWSVVPSLKYWAFNSQSGHISRLCVWSLIQMHMGGHCLMFFCLSLPLSLGAVRMSSDED